MTTAELVYDLLIRECGAVDEDRTTFVDWFQDRTSQEYRF